MPTADRAVSYIRIFVRGFLAAFVTRIRSRPVLLKRVREAFANPWPECLYTNTAGRERPQAKVVQ